MLTKRLIACFDVVDGRVTKAQQFQDNIDVAPGRGARAAALRRPDRRDRLLRHHRQRASGARSTSTPCARVAAARVRAVHRRRRHPLGRRHVRGAQGGRREDQRRLDGGAQPRHHPRGRRGVRSPVHRAEHAGEARRRPGRHPERLRGVHRRRPRRRPASTRSTGCGAARTSARARSSSTASTATAPRRATTSRSRARSPTRSTCPVIASGGAGTVDHIADGLTDGGASGRDHQLDPLLAAARPEPRRARAQGRARRARRPDAPLPRRRRASTRVGGRDRLPVDRGRVGPQPIEVVVRRASRRGTRGRRCRRSRGAPRSRRRVPRRCAGVDPSCASSACSTSSTIVRTWRVLRALDDHEAVDDGDDVADVEDDDVVGPSCPSGERRAQPTERRAARRGPRRRRSSGLARRRRGAHRSSSTRAV